MMVDSVSSVKESAAALLQMSISNETEPPNSSDCMLLLGLTRGQSVQRHHDIHMKAERTVVSAASQAGSWSSVRDGCDVAGELVSDKGCGSLDATCRRVLSCLSSKSTMSPCIFSAAELADGIGESRRRVYDILHVLEAIGVVCRNDNKKYKHNGLDNVGATLSGVRAEVEMLKNNFREGRVPKAVCGLSGGGFFAPTMQPNLDVALRLLSEGQHKQRLVMVTRQFLQLCFLQGPITEISLKSAGARICVDHTTAKAKGKRSKGGAGAGIDQSDNGSGGVGSETCKPRSAGVGRRLYDVISVLSSVGLVSAEKSKKEKCVVVNPALFDPRASGSQFFAYYLENNSPESASRAGRGSGCRGAGAAAHPTSTAPSTTSSSRSAVSASARRSSSTRAIAMAPARAPPPYHYAPPTHPPPHTGQLQACAGVGSGAAGGGGGAQNCGRGPPHSMLYPAATHASNGESAAAGNSSPHGAWPEAGMMYAGGAACHYSRPDHHGQQGGYAPSQRDPAATGWGGGGGVDEGQWRGGGGQRMVFANNCDTTFGLPPPPLEQQQQHQHQHQLLLPPRHGGPSDGSAGGYSPRVVPSLALEGVEGGDPSPLRGRPKRSQSLTAADLLGRRRKRANSGEFTPPLPSSPRAPPPRTRSQLLPSTLALGTASSPSHSPSFSSHPQLQLRASSQAPLNGGGGGCGGDHMAALTRAASAAVATFPLSWAPAAATAASASATTMNSLRVLAPRQHDCSTPASLSGSASPVGSPPATTADAVLWMGGGTVSSLPPAADGGRPTMMGGGGSGSTLILGGGVQALEQEGGVGSNA